MVPFAGAWSDLGAWDAIAREMGPDAAGVALAGRGARDRLRATACCAPRAPSQVLVGIGLKNIVAIAMRDAVLVADITDGQRVKEAVALLKARGAAAGHRVPALPPALGLVRDAVARPPLPGQAHHGASGRASCRCRATCTAPSTGWWWRARRG